MLGACRMLWNEDKVLCLDQDADYVNMFSLEVPVNTLYKKLWLQFSPSI